MGKKKRGSILLLMVLFCVGYLAGCSAEELLTEVPGTMQIQQEITETTQTEDENAQTESDTEQAEEEEEENTDNSFLSENAFRYAYESLTETEQLWYADIEQALGSMEEKVKLSEAGLEAGLDEKCIDKIFQCVLLDHPEIFYVDGYTYTKYSRGNTTVAIDFAGSYQLSKEEAFQRKVKIEQAAAAMTSDLSPQASDYEKVKYVYETLISKTEYDLSAPDNQNICSVFLGGASVCQGYAKATQYLLNRLGVQCSLVQGEVEGGEGHAWNLVWVDGSCYYVDTTWGDASYQREDGQEAMQFLPEINYDYLCVTTAQLLRTHTLGNVVPLPECVDTAANYYVRQGALFEEYDREKLKRVFEEALSAGKKDVTIKCADTECYRGMEHTLIEEQEIFTYLPEGNASVSYAQNEKQLSLTFWVTN